MRPAVKKRKRDDGTAVPSFLVEVPVPAKADTKTKTQTETE